MGRQEDVTKFEIVYIIIMKIYTKTEVICVNACIHNSSFHVEDFILLSVVVTLVRFIHTVEVYFK